MNFLRLYRRRHRENILLGNGCDAVQYARSTCTLLYPSLYAWEKAMPGASFEMEAVGDTIHIRGSCDGKTATSYITFAMMLDASHGYDGGYTALMLRCRDHIAPNLNFSPEWRPDIQYKQVRPHKMNDVASPENSLP